MKIIEEYGKSNDSDAYKNVKGRKRHLLVDTLGLPFSIYVTPAHPQTGPERICCLPGLSDWCLV